MSDLFDDLQDGSGLDFFFELDAAPGTVSPSPALLTLFGQNTGILSESFAFRSPAIATLTLTGLSFSQEIPLQPASATLSVVGIAPTEELIRIITPAIPVPSYSALPNLAPTILFVQTISPTTGSVSITSPSLNVSPGGNIAYITPAAGQVALSGTLSSLVFHAAGLGELSIVGLVPTLETMQIVGNTEDGLTNGLLAINGLAPTLNLPFHWIDADPPPETTWTNAA